MWRGIAAVASRNSAPSSPSAAPAPPLLSTLSSQQPTTVINLQKPKIVPLRSPTAHHNTHLHSHHTLPAPSSCPLTPSPLSHRPRAPAQQSSKPHRQPNYKASPPPSHHPSPPSVPASRSSSTRSAQQEPPCRLLPRHPSTSAHPSTPRVWPQVLPHGSLPSSTSSGVTSQP